MGATSIGLAGANAERQAFSAKVETDLPVGQITRFGLAGARTYREPFADKVETFIGEGIGLWNYPVAYRKRKVR